MQLGTDQAFQGRTDGAELLSTVDWEQARGRREQPHCRLLYGIFSLKMTESIGINWRQGWSLV